MLNEAGGIQLAVRARTPREYMVFFAWGLAMALFGPMRDLGDNSAVGGIGQWVVLAVVLGIIANYMRHERQVRVSERTPIWVALALGAWALAASQLLPSLLDGTIDFAYALGGILAAAPVFLWAQHLRRNA